VGGRGSEARDQRMSDLNFKDILDHRTVLSREIELLRLHSHQR
jgi:hypothetical protein